MAGWGDRIKNAAVGQFFGWVFRQAWAAVLASGAIGAALAYLQNLPLLYMYLAALVAAALTMFVFAQNSIRRTLSSPKHKIVVEAMDPTHWIHNQTQFIQPRLIFRNLGNFPIEIDVKDVSWSMDGLTGTTQLGLQMSAVVPPLGQQVLRGSVFSRPVPVGATGEPTAAPANIDAHVHFRYGRPESLRYRHNQNYILRYWVDPNYEGSTVWIEQIGKGRYA